MKVEIWSDVMCPFCYIGKRKFEKGLAQFAHHDQVEIEWKSFQLDPDMVTDPTAKMDAYLAERKGWTLEQARQAQAHVSNIAAEVGLHYQMEKAVVANSFDAHRFSHLAKKHGLQDAAEEKLFQAYFIEGKNIADHQTLSDIGTSIGLDATEVKQVLDSDQYADEVHSDIYQAQQIGARGVPFFVIDGKYGVSGAQDGSTFLSALNKAWSEHKPLTVDAYGNICGPDGCAV